MLSNPLYLSVYYESMLVGIYTARFLRILLLYFYWFVATGLAGFEHVFSHGVFQGDFSAFEGFLGVDEVGGFSACYCFMQLHVIKLI